ncbi:hypothetical protein KEM56_005883 [Ascosphaera pollenicola]|nr:hypothetical protein KEM56_005883 [Ascosphaera pollenicola]
MLPLGLRVQEKLEKLIDKQMRSLGASKVSLSSLSSQALWHKTSRLNKDSELFQLEDRRGAKYLLAPTHEEEITSLVGGLVKSYRDLPIRLYQITRKYRDEPRPRQGLLRGREFIMKDLYTFDIDVAAAMETYTAVKSAYVRLFDELKVPYKIAAADSGNIGGDFSHEFHIPSAKGEDTVIACKSCHHTWNDELSTGQQSHDLKRSPKQVAPGVDPEPASVGTHEADAISTDVWMGLSADGATLVRAFYPKFLLPEGCEEPVQREPSAHAIKAICQSLGIRLHSGIKNALDKWQANLAEGNQGRVVDIYDYRVRKYDRPPIAGLLASDPQLKTAVVHHSMVDVHPESQAPLDCIKALPGDVCPKCGEKAIETHTTIELGHTFHLGTRYSKLLGANVTLDSAKVKNALATSPGSQTSASVPLEMGCHGIGVSRMMSAVADTLSDSMGLNWPRAIAPFEAVIIADKSLSEMAEKVYDSIAPPSSPGGGPVDAIIDDREKSLIWRMRDADLVGYPIIIVLGKAWKTEGKLEVQCRRLDGLRENVSLDDLPAYTQSLLGRL